MIARAPAWLVLEDGSAYPGRGFGAAREGGGEVVFHTGLTGYQEIVTDPSYRGQIVVLTAPQIGNYGICPEDSESARIHVAGLVIRELAPRPSNWRSRQSLDEYLAEADIPGIDGVDTRDLTRRIRDKGALRGVIVRAEPEVVSSPGEASSTSRDVASGVLPDPALGAAWERARQLAPMEGQDLVPAVTCASTWAWHGTPGAEDKDPMWLGTAERADTNQAATAGASGDRDGRGLSVFVYDFGVKWNILRSLRARGCTVQVVPAATPPEEVLEKQPSGVVLSNGPGDPAAVSYGVSAAREIMARVPTMGICLGHQLLGLAAGALTFKLKFGHHGANHPVRRLSTGAVEITSQNHGFAVHTESLDRTGFVATRINLNDGTLEGMRHRELPVVSVQYHPEAAPGPHDAAPLFDQFIGLMRGT